MNRIIYLIVITIVSAGFVTTATAGSMLNGAGASFPYPVYSAWAYTYHMEVKEQVNYQSIGSGGGVRQIVNRTVDFGASDDALKPEFINEKKLLQWPQVIGGEVLVVNIPGLKPGEMVLDGAVVCKIFLGEISQWNDPAIKALNASLTLPAKKITVVHRSDGSGTTAVFTHYLDELCPAWHERVGYGKSVKWPVGIGGKGNEGVANYAKRVKHSIGYVEYAYAKQNRLSHTRLVNRAGKVVEPTLESFAAAAASGNYDPKKHFYTWVTNANGEAAWPIVAATNIIVARDKVEANRRVVKFFDWTFSDKSDDVARRLVYAPLPDSLKKKVREYWKTNGLY
ncbi:MAG: phosphate ABC transporter substrate-binding protein PstS [Thermodesulfobacteriota bacterium]